MPSRVSHIVAHFRRKPARSAVAVGAGLLAILVVLLVATRAYPVALVNGAPVTAARFEKNYASARVYYANLEKSLAESARSAPAGGAEEPTLKITPPEDLSRMVLDQLVNAVLIGQEARREVGSDLTELIADKVSQYETDEELKQGAKVLYGLDFPDFREEVLKPQAAKDILAGRLFLKDQDFDAWLTSARASARIVILSSKFRWDGSAVVSAP